MFNYYLGTPDNKNVGLIQKYYNEYNEYPSSITMKNFDFYTPFSDINIKSSWAWIDDLNVATKAKSIYPDPPNSSIDLSKLLVNMGVNFNLNRYEPSIQDLLNQLKQVPTVHILKSECQPNKDNKYYASNNQNTILIRDELDDDGFSTIVDQLTFSGELIPGKISSIEVYYDGIDQGWSIPVEMF